MENASVYTTFEREFGRELSPMETEFISEWKSTYKEETIILALREAVYRGVKNFSYIAKVLQNWNQDKTPVTDNKNELPFDDDWLN